MHIRIHRYDPQKEEKPVLPSSKNFRKQDLIFLRVIMILLTIMLVYCVPYELAVMENIHEESGVLQEVRQEKSAARRSNEIVGLNLVIDGKEYYLDGGYIEWNEYYLSGKQIEGKSTDEVWKIKNLEHKLKKTIDQPITILYLKYKDYLGRNHLTVVDASSNNNQWITMEYALSMRKSTVRAQALAISICMLVFAALYYFRRNYNLEIKRQKK